MPALLDTGVLAAYVNPHDALHGRARELMTEVLGGTHGVPYVTDAVLAETLALFHARGATPAAVDAFLGLVRLPGKPGRFEVVGTSLVQWRDALDAWMRHRTRRLSLADCSLLVHAGERGAAIVTFDSGFRGLADVVV